MDQPFEEIKFTYSRREYTLPGSSRFTKLLYASPDAFQERFFSYRENRTELARKETRAILTCAYVRYLMFMESNSLLTKGEKDHLLGLWKAHPRWDHANPRPDRPDNGSSHAGLTAKQEPAPTSHRDDHRSSSSTATGLASSVPSGPRGNLLNGPTAKAPVRLTRANQVPAPESTRLSSSAGPISFPSGPSASPGSMSRTYAKSAHTPFTEYVPLRGANGALVSYSRATATALPASTDSAVAIKKEPMHPSPIGAREVAAPSSMVPVADMKQSALDDQSDQYGETQMQGAVSARSETLPQSHSGSGQRVTASRSNLESMNFKEYIDWYTKGHPLVFEGGDPPWGSLIETFKHYVRRHLGPESHRYISKALTSSELRNQIPPDVFQHHMRLLVLEGRERKSSFPQSGNPTVEGKKRGRAETGMPSNSPSRKALKSGEPQLPEPKLPEPSTTSGQRVLGVTSAAEPKLDPSALAPPSPKGPFSRPYSPSFPKLPAEVKGSWATSHVPMKSAPVRGPPDAFQAPSTTDSMEEEEITSDARHEPPRLTTEPGNRVSAAKAAMGYAHGRSSSPTAGVHSTRALSPKVPPPLSNKKLSLSSLLLTEKLDRASVKAIVRAEGYLHDAQEDLQRMTLEMDPTAQEGTARWTECAVMVRALLRRALAEISEPRGGIAMAVLSIEACVAEAGEHVDRVLLPTCDTLTDLAFNQALRAPSCLIRSALKEIGVVSDICMEGTELAP